MSKAPQQSGPNRWLDRLKACHAHAVPFRGVIYRSVSPAYANDRDLVTGDGALRVPGRWHAAGSCRVVYGALSPETSLAEALAHFRYFGIPDADAMPRVLVAVDCVLQTVLDLALPAISRALKVKSASLAKVDWRKAQPHSLESSSQSLGWAAHASN